jgi:hypothetical protein
MYVLWIGGDRFDKRMCRRKDLDGAPDPGTKLFVLGPCADEEDSAAWL